MPTPPPTFLDRYKDYELYLPNGGGKAGTGKNATSTIQVRRKQCLEKQFRFTLGKDQSSYFDALQKARDWIDAHPIETSQAQIESTDRVSALRIAIARRLGTINPSLSPQEAFRCLPSHDEAGDTLVPKLDHNALAAVRKTLDLPERSLFMAEIGREHFALIDASPQDQAEAMVRAGILVI